MEAVQRIPLEVGLITVRAVADTQGDYESIRSTTAVGSAGYSSAIRAEVPDRSGGKTRETAPMADHLHARTMRSHYDEGDPAVSAGTTPGVPADIVKELCGSGRATKTFLDQRTIFGLASVRRLTGPVVRVGAGAEDFSVIVNGRRASVRLLHAKGRLADESGAGELEFHVLKTPTTP